MTPEPVSSPVAKVEPPNTRDLILDAAVELFAQRGYHATSIREIAAAVPLQAAGIYYWYENKEAILLQLERSFLDGLNDVVVNSVARHKNPASRLAVAVREHVVFHGLYPQAAFVTDSELRALTGDDRLEIQAKRDEYQKMFVEMVEDGVRAGVFQTSDVKIASYAILLECTGVALWFDPAGSRTLEEVAKVHIELALGSLFASQSLIAKATHDSEHSS